MQRYIDMAVERAEKLIGMSVHMRGKSQAAPIITQYVDFANRFVPWVGTKCMRLEIEQKLHVYFFCCRRRA